MEFKDRLKELRIDRGLSQMQLAKELNLSQSAVAKWELGKTEPTASAIIAVARYFNETADFILGITD
ncbi:MAG: helix-turn-helix transcriptional regulator [Clostridia bacterium]|nr:helix-turn-helix transcriptional regulator [Clostridia bacterium]